MPIDPSIPLSVRAPQIDVLGTYSQILGLQAQREQAAALAEQRRAIADQRRAQTDVAQREREEGARLRELFAGGKPPSPGQIYSIVGPERGKAIVEGLDALTDREMKRYKDGREVLGKVIVGLKALPESVRRETYDAAVAEFTGRGWLDAAQIPPYGPGVLEQFERELMTPDQRYKVDHPEPYTLTPGAVRYDGQGNKIAEVPTKPADPAKVGSFEDYVERFAKERGIAADQLTPAQIEEARKRYQQADDRPRITVTTPRPLTQNAEAALITRYRSEWAKVNAGAVELDRQMSIMDAGLAAAERGDVAQANEAVLNTFLKVLDPTSVVREGEFWRLKEGQSLIDRAKAAVQRLHQGGWVAGEELQKYARLAREIRDATKRNVEPRKAVIQKNLDRYNIPGELVFEDPVADGADGADGVAPAPSAQPGPTEGERRAIPGLAGGEAEYRGGRWIRVK